MTEKTFTIKINEDKRELSLVRHLGEGKCNVLNIQYRKLKHGLDVVNTIIREVINES